MSLVLIADDEPGLLYALEEVVIGMGHQALTASNGEEALSLARARVPNLIVTDQMMPRLTGLELLREVRADRKLAKTPCILMSAARVPAPQADLYLVKPFAIEEFEAAIKRLLASAPVEQPAAPLDSADLLLAHEEMLNWVAHEIRTPLSAARMNAQLIERDLKGPDSEKQARRVQTVLRALERMDALVTSVLEASRLSESKLVLRKQPVELKEFLTEIVSGWRHSQPDFEFLLAIPDEGVVLELDAERIRQVLDNFFSNAVKHGLPSQRIETTLQVSPAQVEIRIRDFGRGIAREELPQIFDRFHREKTAHGEGHGLGLFIAATLARLHGGEATVESTVGEGSTFTLRLPRER